MLKSLFLSLIILLSLHAKETEVTLVLPWKHQFQFAGYYMAKEKGFYKEAGLQVNFKEFDLKSDTAGDVASGKYEFGVKHSTLILDLLNKHENLKLLAAINQSSPFVLICKQRDDIKSLKDIKNKTIMMSNEDAQNSSLLAMLKLKKISPNSYKILNTNFNLNNLINGKVDMVSAYLSNEPFVLIKKKINYTVFNPKDYGYDFYSDILFTSQEFIDKQPKVVEAFYKASIKGWKYAYAHIDESVDIILKH
jgi:ABC-type nitrate/sulfonate/bicarbonate transport system substrate-binding protein